MSNNTVLTEHTMRVTIMYRNSYDGGDGWQYYPKTIEISTKCPICGSERGKPYDYRFCEDGEWFNVEKWDNKCGHVDTYGDVYREWKIKQSIPSNTEEGKGEEWTGWGWTWSERSEVSETSSNDSHIPFSIHALPGGSCVCPIADIVNFPPATDGQVNQMRANARLLASSKDLYYALKGIVEDWVGKDSNKHLPVYKEYNDPVIGKGGYWNPGAKMVASEFISKAIEVLKKANPSYKP